MIHSIFFFSFCICSLLKTIAYVSMFLLFILCVGFAEADAGKRFERGFSEWCKIHWLQICNYFTYYWHECPQVTQFLYYSGGWSMMWCSESNSHQLVAFEYSGNHKNKHCSWSSTNVSSLPPHRQHSWTRALRDYPSWCWLVGPDTLVYYLVFGHISLQRNLIFFIHVIRGHLCSMDEIDTAYREALLGRASSRPLIEMTIPSVLDQTIAPPGLSYHSILLNHSISYRFSQQFSVSQDVSLKYRVAFNRS